MSESSFPGGLRGKPGIETEGLIRLLGHYDAYEPFLQSCRDARLELESPLTSPAKQQVLETLGPAAAEKLGEGLLIRCVEREVIESLAKRWNLDRIPEVQDSLHWNFKDGVARIGDCIETQTLRPFTFFGGMNLVTVGLHGQFRRPLLDLVTYQHEVIQGFQMWGNARSGSRAPEVATA